MTNVAFIGLGIMGNPMAGHLAKAGHTVTGFNRHPNYEDLEAAGGRGAGSLKDAVADADVVCIMVPDSPDVREVLEGEGGVFDSAKPGTLIVDFSSIRPDVTVELAQAATERGFRLIDAPVSGGEKGAKDAVLSIMVGGDAKDVEEARPLLETVGKTVVHVGGPGAGQVVKACNQIVVALTYAALSEALVLGSKSGIDPALVLDVLGGGLAANRVMEMRRRNFLEHDFTPGFRVDLHHKDLNIALESGDAYGVPLPATSLAQQMLRTLRAKGRGADDHTALLTVIEDWAAVQEEIPCPA